MSRPTLSPIFTLLKNPPHQSPFSSSAPSNGLWKNRSVSPDRSLTEPAPLGGPEGKTYVPTSLRSTLLGSIHTRLSGRYRRLGGTSGPTAMTTSTAGTTSSLGPSMHRTPSGRPPQNLPHSSAYSATNPLCSPGQKSPPTFQLLTTGSERAREFGTQPMSTSSRQCGDTRALQMPAGLTPPSITQEIRSGSRPGICVSACPAVS